MSTGIANHEKRCPKCGESKDLGGFYKERSRPDGLSGWCRECTRAKNRERYAENKDVVLAATAKYRAENKEQLAITRAARNARYRAEEPERLKAQAARQYARHKKSLAAKAAEHRSDLSPGYVASTLGLPLPQVTPELLALKREQLLAHRALKALNKTLKDLNGK